MQRTRSGLLIALASILLGALAFFLFLYVIGHDPDESPLTLMEWVVAGMLIAPGFGLLLRWRRANTR